jgi:hypothetical protein
MGGLGTDLTMTGTSRYISGGTGTKPDASGTYSLSPGTTIEFSNNSSSTENTRLSPSYYNIVVSGSSVANSSLSSTPLLFQSGGSFTVTSTGSFKHANVNGFSGAINTSISNTNNPTINLQNGSTIDYYRMMEQIRIYRIQVNIGQGATGNYYHLIISGTGNKTAPAGTLEIKGNFTSGWYFQLCT